MPRFLHDVDPSTPPLHFADEIDVWSAPPATRPVPCPPVPSLPRPFSTQPNPNWQLEQGAKEDWGAYNNGRPDLTTEIGLKFDQDKPRCDLLPSKPLLAVADVLTYGADKYADHNWRKGLAYSRVLAATQRHLLAFNDGIDIDDESGLPHLAHAACNLMFLLEFTQTGTGTDDRFKQPHEKPTK